MASGITQSEVIALGGLCFGLAGFVLGVMNFRRDNPKVLVELSWDMSVTPGTAYDPNKKWGIVTISNVGRRPIFLSHVALRVPAKYGHNHLVLSEGIFGRKLQEGDEPARFMVSQDGLERYAPDWMSIRAQVSDSAGKVYRSSHWKPDQCPSWAKTAE